MAKLVSKTYGDALFQLAQEQKELSAIYEECEALLVIIFKNPELLQLLHHPKLTKEERQNILNEIFGTRVSDTMMGLLETMNDKGRTNELGEVLAYYRDRYREHEGIGVAQIRSAVPLSDEQKERLQKRLVEVTRYSSFVMNYQVDEALIGGLVIRIGDRVLDSSIKTKLNHMERELMNVSVNGVNS